MADITPELLATEKYVRLTTFTKDGRPKPVPIWLADLGDGTVGFTTDRTSWKVKRMTNTPAVELTPSDARGRVADDAPTYTATATVAVGSDADRVEAAIKAKYGLQYDVISAIGWIRARLGRGDDTPCGVIITLD